MRTPTFTAELSWEREQLDDEAESATWGELTISLGDEVVWGTTTGSPRAGLRWTWVDLLEHLAEIWPYLVYEDGWPAGPLLDDPARFLSNTRAWLEGLPAEEAAEKEDELYEFRHRHDLAMAIRGKVVPQLWIVREGNRAWVSGESCSAVLGFDDVETTLRALGDQIAERLAGVDDERAREAVSSWKSRLELGTPALAAICVGVPEADLLTLAGGDIEAVFDLDVGLAAETFVPNDLLAAARMTVHTTDPSIVRAILGEMRAIPRRETSRLDQLSAAARSQLEDPGSSAKPAALGYHLAGWLRNELGLAGDQRVDPDALLRDWNVFVGELGVDDDALEAVACWGPTRGPAILVNTGGRHSQAIAGRRATLAHEICHLLVDRAAALPLVEVFGGHVSRALEQRANAFAAELLIPREIAGAAFHDHPPNEVLDRLCRLFGVGRELVAWQAHNSRYELSWSTFSVLRRQVSQPHRFHRRASSITR